MQNLPKTRRKEATKPLVIEVGANGRPLAFLDVVDRPIHIHIAKSVGDQAALDNLARFIREQGERVQTIIIERSVVTNGRQLVSMVEGIAPWLCQLTQPGAGELQFIAQKSKSTAEGPAVCARRITFATHANKQSAHPPLVSVSCPHKDSSKKRVLAARTSFEEMKASKNDPKETSKQTTETDDFACPICLCTPLRCNASTIDSCKHSFCFECVHRWSQQSNTCPLCKSRFTAITRTHPIQAREGLSSPLNYVVVLQRDQGKMWLLNSAGDEFEDDENSDDDSSGDNSYSAGGDLEDDENSGDDSSGDSSLDSDGIEFGEEHRNGRGSNNRGGFLFRPLSERGLRGTRNGCGYHHSGGLWFREAFSEGVGRGAGDGRGSDHAGGSWFREAFSFLEGRGIPEYEYIAHGRSSNDRTARGNSEVAQQDGSSV